MPSQARNHPQIVPKSRIKEHGSEEDYQKALKIRPNVKLPIVPFENEQDYADVLAEFEDLPGEIELMPSAKKAKEELVRVLFFGESECCDLMLDPGHIEEVAQASDAPDQEELGYQIGAIFDESTEDYRLFAGHYGQEDSEHIRTTMITCYLGRDPMYERYSKEKDNCVCDVSLAGARRILVSVAACKPPPSKDVHRIALLGLTLKNNLSILDKKGSTKIANIISMQPQSVNS